MLAPIQSQMEINFTHSVNESTHSIFCEKFALISISVTALLFLLDNFILQLYQCLYGPLE